MTGAKRPHLSSLAANIDFLRRLPKLTGLSGMIDESDDPPTQGAGAVFDLLGERLDVERIKFDRIVGDDLQAFNELVSRSGIAPVSP